MTATTARRSSTTRSKDPNAIPTSGEVLANLRALCLSLPETSERGSWGHPNFLAGKKTFVTFEHIQGRPSIAFKLERADVERLSSSEQFFPTPYGRGQWISVWVDTYLESGFVRNLVMRSYRLVAIKRRVAALGGITRRR